MKKLLLSIFVHAAILLLSLNNVGLAQEKDSRVTLPTVVVSGSRIPTPLEKSSSNATIVTREEIEARNPISMVDLLRQIPGVHVDQLGGRGGISSVYLRGSEPNFTLVLIDGIRVNDPTNSRGGSFDLSTLNVENVERVEIVRGPLSTVHGSDAMAGVINVVTIHGTAAPEHTVEVGAGRQDAYRGHVTARGPCSDFGDYALGAGYVDNGTQVEGDEFVSNSFDGKISVFPSDVLDVQWIIRHSDNRSSSYPDDSGGPTFAVRREVDERDTEDFDTGLQINMQPTSSISFTLGGSWYHHEEDYTSPGVAPGAGNANGVPANRGDSVLDRWTMGAKSVISLFDGLQVSLGVDSVLEEGASNTILDTGFGDARFPFDLTRDVYSPFGELQYTSEVGLTLYVGYRADIPDDFDTEYSSKVGAMYRMESIETTIKGNWGQGFKFPSFFALAHPLVGNPDFRPETSEGFGFSLIKDLWERRVSISVSPFYTRFFNLIDYDESGRLVQRPEVTSQGAELAISVDFDAELWINAHVSYAETDMNNTQEELRNRPEWRGGLSTGWKPRENWTLNIDILSVGEALDSSIPTGDRTLEEYTRVDISTQWAFTQNLEAAFAIDNFLDTDYEEAVGFPGPGIQPRVSVRLTF